MDINLFFVFTVLLLLFSRAMFVIGNHAYIFLKQQNPPKKKTRAILRSFLTFFFHYLFCRLSIFLLSFSFFFLSFLEIISQPLPFFSLLFNPLLMIIIIICNKKSVHLTCKQRLSLCSSSGRPKTVCENRHPNKEFFCYSCREKKSPAASRLLNLACII